MVRKEDQCFVNGRQMNMGSIFAKTAVIEMSCESSSDKLVRSFRPIIHAMQVFGIDLNVSKRRSTARCLVFLLYTLLIVSITILSIYVGFSRLSFETEPQINTGYVFTTLGIFFTKLFRAVNEVAIFGMTHFKWEGIWKQMKEIDFILCFPARFCRRIRISTIVALALFFILV